MDTNQYLNDKNSFSAPFHNLMQERVKEIILVSSLYDSFLLSQDGQLRAQLFSEFTELNLRHAPGLTHTFNAEEALKLAHKDKRYNLIITTMRVGEMHVLEFVHRARVERLNIPIILLAFDERELNELKTEPDSSAIDQVFIWRDDFSRWLKARTEFGLAETLYPHKVSDYASIDDLRQFLIHSIRTFRRERSRGLVADFSRDVADSLSGFSRIGSGSLGGNNPGDGRGSAWQSFLSGVFRCRSII